MKLRFFRFVKKVLINRFKYFWFRYNPLYSLPCTVSQSLNSNFQTDSLFLIHYFIEIFYFNCSNSFEITNLKFLNWPVFSGLLQSPPLKTFRPRNGNNSKVGNKM